MSTEHEKIITDWVKMWNEGSVHFASDVAYPAIRAIAESGKGDLFHLPPLPIQTESENL